MSAYVTVRCDGCDYVAVNVVDTRLSPVRRYLYRNGWTAGYTYGHNTSKRCDYCPTCSAKRATVGTVTEAK